jgi:hypothetical protein
VIGAWGRGNERIDSTGSAVRSPRAAKAPRNETIWFRSNRGLRQAAKVCRKVACAATRSERSSCAWRVATGCATKRRSRASASVPRIVPRQNTIRAWESRPGLRSADCSHSAGRSARRIYTARIHVCSKQIANSSPRYTNLSNSRAVSLPVRRDSDAFRMSAANGEIPTAIFALSIHQTSGLPVLQAPISSCATIRRRRTSDRMTSARASLGAGNAYLRNDCLRCSVGGVR